MGFKIQDNGLDFKPYFPLHVNAEGIDLAGEITSFFLSSLGAAKGKIAITFSGGADSAVLLGALREAVGPERIVALTQSMTGFDGELERAREICEELGVEICVVEGEVKADAVLRSFIKRTMEPVCDEVVPVLHNLVSEGTRIAGPFEFIVDGQGADSLLMGLPHNKLMDLHRWTRFMRPLFRLLSIKKTDRGSTKFQRLIYRAIKIANSLKLSEPMDSVIESLKFNNSISNSNRVLAFMRDELADVTRHYGSIHKALSYLFMFRILPAREMQKYKLLSESNSFLLPFLDTGLIERVFSLKEDMLISGGTYKKPVYDATEKYFGNRFRNISTAPFYVRYDIGSDKETGLQEFSIKVLSELLSENRSY